MTDICDTCATLVARFEWRYSHNSVTVKDLTGGGRGRGRLLLDGTILSTGVHFCSFEHFFFLDSMESERASECLMNEGDSFTKTKSIAKISTPFYLNLGNIFTLVLNPISEIYRTKELCL